MRKSSQSAGPRGGMPGKQGKQAAGQEGGCAGTGIRDGRRSATARSPFRTARICLAGQIATGGATARAGDAPQEPDEPEFLAGMHRFQKGGRDLRSPGPALPAGGSHRHQTGQRPQRAHGALPHLGGGLRHVPRKTSGRRYRRRALPPSRKRWVALQRGRVSPQRVEGSPVGRYEPRVRSSEIIFAPPIVWEAAGERDTLREDRAGGVPPGRRTTSTVRQAPPARTPATGNSHSRTTH